MRILAATLCMCLAALAHAISISMEEMEALEKRYQLPSEEELPPLHSLAMAERDELHKQLGVLNELYEVKQTWAGAEHFGLSSAAEYVLFDLGLFLQSPKHKERARQLVREQREIHAALWPKHEPWLFETSHGALAEEPPDWRIVSYVLRIGSKVEYHSEMERLARDVLEAPISGDWSTGRRAAVRWALIYLRREWPDDAAAILDTVLTLPQQPWEREILPVAEGESRPDEVERELVSVAGGVVYDLQWFPERAEELLARIEASLEANAYTLDDKAREALDRLRSRLEELES